MLVDLKQITKEVRDDIGGDLTEIRKIASFMLKSVSSTMEEGKWESVYLQYLGTFKVKPDRLFFLKKRGYDIGEAGDRIVESKCKKNG